MINLEAVVLQEVMQWVGDLGVKDINKGDLGSHLYQNGSQGTNTILNVGAPACQEVYSQSLSKCSITWRLTQQLACKIVSWSCSQTNTLPIQQA